MKLTILILLAATTAIGAGIGAYEGYHHGRKGTTIRLTCRRAWKQSVIILICFLIAASVTLSILHFSYTRDFKEALLFATLGIFFSIIYSCIATTITAPMAAIIAHNFGTQRRIREDLAKPPET